MISVIARSFAGGHEMRAACDIPEDLTRAALETLDRRFSHLLRHWSKPEQELSQFGELAMMLFGCRAEEAAKERTRAMDAATGVTHHDAGRHFREDIDRSLIVAARIDSRGDHSIQRPWALTRSVDSEIFHGLAARLAVNRVETVEEAVCRTVFDALQDVILEQKKPR